MDEKDFFTESEERHKASLNCPSCRQQAEYELRWVVRRKKATLPPRASEEDRQRFARARAYIERARNQARVANYLARQILESHRVAP